jgi:serine/threonine-protein kinase
MANAITGTPLYMSPESLTLPESADGRADLYALGAVGYWLLTGTHVFGGTTIVEVCAHHLHTPPEPPSARLKKPVSADLEGLLLACLAKSPAGRPASANQLRERLRACERWGTWSNARAAAWWAAHRKQMRSGGGGSQKPRSGSPALTMTRLAD